MRIAQLEGKIESLLSAVQSMADSSGPSGTIAQILGRENISLPARGTTSGSAGGIPAQSIIENLTPPTATPPNEQLHRNPELSDPSPWQAEEHLDFFRSRMLPYFPFIVLPRDTTASQLRQDRPVLFQAILTVTTFSTQEKMARAEHFKHLLFTSALIHAQSNMDLLLGLLTYLAWSTDLFLGRADLVSRLMMLAISLVYDLRLFKSSPPDVQLIMTITQGAPYETGQNAGGETVQRLMEKQRALLACFILSSKYATQHHPSHLACCKFLYGKRKLN